MKPGEISRPAQAVISMERGELIDLIDSLNCNCHRLRCIELAARCEKNDAIEIIAADILDNLQGLVHCIEHLAGISEGGDA